MGGWSIYKLNFSPYSEGIPSIFLGCACTRAYWVSKVSEETLKQNAERCVLEVGPCKVQAESRFAGNCPSRLQLKSEVDQVNTTQVLEASSQEISQKLPCPWPSSLVSSWKSGHLYFLTYHLFSTHHDQISNSVKLSYSLIVVLITGTSDGHF